MYDGHLTKQSGQAQSHLIRSVGNWQPNEEITLKIDLKKWKIQFYKKKKKLGELKLEKKKTYYLCGGFCGSTSYPNNNIEILKS